jgi:SRP-independent targeting protein 2/TMEM208
LLGRWQMAGFLFTSAVYWVCYKGVVEAAGARSGGAGYYLDLLVLTAATQVLCLFSNKGWYLYMLVRLNS